MGDSEVMESFCSAFENDELFGSISSWGKCERSVSGGAANPSYQRSVIQIMAQTFDESVSRYHSYFRIALLPGGLEVEVSMSTKHGETVSRIPRGCYHFLHFLADSS